MDQKNYCRFNFKYDKFQFGTSMTNKAAAEKLQQAWANDVHYIL